MKDLHGQELVTGSPANSGCMGVLWDDFDDSVAAWKRQSTEVQRGMLALFGCRGQWCPCRLLTGDWLKTPGTDPVECPT